MAEFVDAAVSLAWQMRRRRIVADDATLTIEAPDWAMGRLTDHDRARLGAARIRIVTT